MSGPAAPAATLSAACCSRRPIGTGASTLLLHAIGRCCCRRWRLAARGRAAPATEEDALRATDCIGWRALRAGGCVAMRWLIPPKLHLSRNGATCFFSFRPFALSHQILRSDIYSHERVSWTAAPLLRIVLSTPHATQHHYPTPRHAPTPQLSHAAPTLLASHLGASLGSI